MTRLLFIALALGACASDGPQTGPGDMKLAENTGGFCDAQSPWCGYDLMFNGTSLVVTSRSTPATGTGTLTQKGLADVEALVAEVPYDAPDDNSECLDAPIVRLHIAFQEVGERTFQYVCKPGVLQPLGSYVTRLGNAVINFESDDTVVVDAPF
ncbi:MAG: hypothetical protein ACKV2T_38145 [Kofleriaceae bacterium]